MHIGFLTPEYPTQARPEGGLAIYLQKVSQGLVERGHDVTVFVAGPQPDTAAQDGAIEIRMVRDGWLQRLGRHMSGSLGKVLGRLGQVQTARRIERSVWKVHRTKPIDLLQTSSYQTPGYTLRHNGSIPLVCRLSSYTPLYRSAFGRQRSLDDHWAEWLEIRQVVDADAVFAPCALTANTFARLESRLPDVIRTPLDQTPVKLDETFWQDRLAGRKYLLYFGTFNRIKGVDLIADILPEVLARHQDLDVVCIGRDEGMPAAPSLGEYLRQQAGTDRRRLMLSPPIAKAQLYPVIANATGVLMPSRVDNYPNACLEALMLGKPVIGTKESSIDEIIVDGQTGILVENGKTDSLRQGIDRLLAMSPGQLGKMESQAALAASAIMHEDRIGQHIAYYEHVISEFHRRQIL